jgi:hypothetical protein
MSGAFDPHLHTGREREGRAGDAKDRGHGARTSTDNGSRRRDAGRSHEPASQPGVSAGGAEHLGTRGARRRRTATYGRAELGETFGVPVTSLDGPPLAMGIHEHPVPMRWNRTTYGVAAPFGVVHHAETEARCGPGDVGYVGHGAHLATGERVIGWRKGRSAAVAPDQ